MNFSSIRAHIASAAARPQVVVAALLVGAGAILFRVHLEYPISEWMLLSLARSWLLSLLWLLACGSLGWRALRLIGADFDDPAIRHLMAVTAGAALFALVVAGAGLAGVLGLAFFFLAPLACLTVSGTGYGADLLRASRSLVQAVRSTRLSAPLIFAMCVLVVGLLLVYAPTLSPHNVQHDARWYHLPIAQQYASQGSLRPFREGWFLASYPHLSSLLYTWAMLMPASIVARLELVAHLEFALFCVTLAGVAIAGRTLNGSRSGYWAAALFFLFPGFLVYDSNLSSGADHVAAFWAPALLILLGFTWIRSRPADWALTGLVIGAAAATKYSAICLVAPAVLSLVVRTLFPGAGGRGTEGWSARLPRLALTGGVALFAASPHWLSNWVAFGDPLYPLLHGWFGSDVWNPDAEMYFERFRDEIVLRGHASWLGLAHALGVALTFGFRVHEYAFHGNLPTFGFLFAISFFLAPLARVNKATWATFGLCLAGILAWFFTYHRDRYIQALLPWMVVASASVLISLYHTRNRWIRSGLAVLLGAQLIAGADIAFIRSHVMIPGKHPLPHAIERLALGFEGKAEERDAPYDTWAFADWTNLGSQLPEDARVLVHRDRLWLGLDAPVVVDEPAWQGGIAYGALGDPARVYDLLRNLGVTHVITGRGHPDGGALSIGGALVFWSFLRNHATQVAKSGHLTLWELRETRPQEDTHPLLVQLRTCESALRPGTYELSALAYVVTQEQAEPIPAAAARFVVTEKGCGTAPSGYRRLTTEDGLTMWER